MTDRHSAIFPMMLAALLGSAVARRVEPNSFYESVAKTYEEDVKT